MPAPSFFSNQSTGRVELHAQLALDQHPVVCVGIDRGDRQLRVPLSAPARRAVMVRHPFPNVLRLSDIDHVLGGRRTVPSKDHVNA